MRLYLNDNLIGLPVVTKIGRDVGRLKDVEVEVETLRITALIVSPSSIIKKIINDDLTISLDQVVEITENEIVVDETVVSDTGSKVEVARPTQTPNPMITSQR